MLKRNPNYKGTRPANPDKIVWTVERDQDQCLLQVKAGQSDIDAERLPPTAAADLGEQFGVNKGQFFVGPTSCVLYWAMNTSRAPFNNLDAPQGRRVGDRPAGQRPPARQVRRQAHRPDPRSGRPRVQGFNLYAIKGADVAKAKPVGGAAIARRRR